MQTNTMKIFARVNLFLLILCIFQLQSSTRATFSLTLNIISHLTRGNCRELFGNGKCDTFFSIFCLRGARGFQNHSTSTSDCPHGTSSDFDDESGSRIIISDERYQVNIRPDQINFLLLRLDIMTKVVVRKFLTQILSSN